MRLIYTTIFIIFFALRSTAQIIDIQSAISTNLNQNSCSPMAFTVSILQGCINYAYLGSSSSVSNDTIYLNINYSGGPICAGALSFPTYTVSVPASPANTYVVYAQSFVNGIVNDIHIGYPLTVTNIGCCPAIAQISFNQNPACLGDTLVMQSIGGGAIMQDWNINGQLISNDTIAYQPVNSNSPMVIELIVSDGTCSDTTSQTINVQTPPLVDLGIDTSICDGSTLTKTVPSGFAQYIWSDSSVTNTGELSTIGNLSVTVQDAFGCVGSDTVAILSLIDLTDVSLSLDSVTLCPGDSVSVSVSSTTLGAGFLWSTGEVSQTIIVSSSGIYTVTASANDLCINTDTFDLEVFEMIPITFSLDSSLCAPRAVEANNDYVSYNWNNGDNTFSTNSSTDDTLTLVVVDANGCSTTSSIFVDVNENPIVDLGPNETICPGGTALLSANAGTGLMVLWSTGETNSNIVVNSAGQYWVQVTDVLGCSGFDTIIVNQVECLGLDEIENNLSFSAFPNPVSSMLNIESAVINYFKLMDATGRIIKSFTVQKGSTVVDMEDQPQGLYLLRNDQHQTMMLLKQ